MEEAAKVIEVQRFHSDFHLSMTGADKMLAAKVRALLTEMAARVRARKP